MNRAMTLIFAGMMVAGLGGCASGLGAGDYSRSQARQAMDVQDGVVVSVSDVQIEGTNTGIGTIGGAVVGGVAGSEIGGGKGSIIGGALGAVLGGVGGHAVEQNVTKQMGWQITVRLNRGGKIAVTQAAKGQPFYPGERVQVLSGGGATRVEHIN